MCFYSCVYSFRHWTVQQKKSYFIINSSIGFACFRWKLCIGYYIIVIQAGSEYAHVSCPRLQPHLQPLVLLLDEIGIISTNGSESEWNELAPPTSAAKKKVKTFISQAVSASNARVHHVNRLTCWPPPPCTTSTFARADGPRRHKSMQIPSWVNACETENLS